MRFAAGPYIGRVKRVAGGKPRPAETSTDLRPSTFLPRLGTGLGRKVYARGRRLQGRNQLTFASPLAVNGPL